MFKKLIIICLSLIIFQPIFKLLAQSTGHISGYVKESANKMSLEGVNVLIEGTSLGAATDEQGYFIIKNVPAGAYQIIISRIGYEKVSQEIKIAAGTTVQIDFLLNQKPILFDKITVTATRYNNNITEVPIATEIISANTIDRSVAQSTGDALESIGSVLIKGNNDLNSMKTISIRGSTDSQVLVLFDGQRLNNSQNASFDFSTIQIDFVDKVEIIKGGHSALYGANAIGGVVNIISKSIVTDKKITAGLKSGIGTWGTQIYSMYGAQNLGKISYLTAFKHLRSNGEYSYQDNVGNKQIRKNNNLNLNQLFVKANYDLTEDERLNFFTLYGKTDRGLPGTITFPSITTKLKERTNLYNMIYENRKIKWLFLKTNLYYNLSNQNFIDTNPWTLENTIHKNKAIGFEIQNCYHLSDNLIATIGYDFRQDRLESTKYRNRRRNIHGLYLMGEIKQKLYLFPLIDKIVLVPALRYDSYTKFNGKTSPKIGVIITHNDKVMASLRGNIGRSFRIPTFNDLYWPEDSWSKGNPDLKTEDGLNYDVGFMLNYQNNKSYANFEFTYFVNKIKNLNMWKEIQPYFWQPQNIDESLTSGTEVQLKISFLQEMLGFRLAHTYINAKYNNKNSPLFQNYLEYRPKHKLDFETNINFSSVQFNMIYRFLDRSFKDENNTQAIPRSNIIDANVILSPTLFGFHILMKIDILNLLDKQFVTFGDQPMPGRQFRVSLGFKY